MYGRNTIGRVLKWLSMLGLMFGLSMLALHGCSTNSPISVKVLPAMEEPPSELMVEVPPLPPIPIDMLPGEGVREPTKPQWERELEEGLAIPEEPPKKPSLSGLV